MRPLATFARSLVAGALLGPVLLAPALMATPAQAADGARARAGTQVTTYLTIEGREVVNIGAPASSAGDTTISRGSVAMTEGGPAVGTFATRIVVVMPDANGRERRDTTIHVSMPSGALFAQQIQDDPTGLPPNTSSDLVVLGGTGAFRNARGVVSQDPAVAGVLRLTWNLRPSIGIDPEQATTVSFERLVDATSSGQATNDANTLSESGSQGRLRMKGQDGAFTCGDAKLAQSRPGGIGLDSWLCRYDLPRGSVLVAAFSQYRGGTAWPSKFIDIILGGTGAYAGARGEAVTDCTSETTADVTLRLLTDTGLPPVPVKFSQDRTYKTFGGLDLADATVIYAGATATQFALGTKRRVGTSASLYVSSFALPDAEGFRRSFGVYGFDLKGGTIRAVAYDEGPTGAGKPTRTLVVTGGTGVFLGATGTIGLIAGKVVNERTVVRIAQ
ncbi:MAG: hypothetical protein ACOYO9_12590 [Candidatus Nanopelagicales bacterium]